MWESEVKSGYPGQALLQGTVDSPPGQQGAAEDSFEVSRSPAKPLHRRLDYHQDGDCLVAYPPEIWDKIESKAQQFSQVDPHQRAFMRYFISSAEECEFDNQGRVLIPPLLRERAGLEQEILLAGVLTSFEIWNRTTWESQINWDRESYQQIMESIAGTGL